LAPLPRRQPPPNTAEDAPPSAKTAPETPQSNEPSPATLSPTTADKNQSISQTCHKQAADKKLTRDDKTNLIKQCKQGKKTSEGSCGQGIANGEHRFALMEERIPSAKRFYRQHRRGLRDCVITQEVRH
jgi:hypothetical protein